MRIPKAATGTTGVGWVYSLRNLPNSDWGSVEEFYASVLGRRSGKEFTFGGDVWGNFRRASRRPNKGDGIAFYHAAAAKFPEHDKFHRSPRISLVGAIEGVAWKGSQVDALHVRANTALSRSLRTYPMVRTKETEEFFTRCGIVQASVATMYWADEIAWYVLNTWLRAHGAKA
jgi:hypothetical protein